MRGQRQEALGSELNEEIEVSFPSSKQQPRQQRLKIEGEMKPVYY